MGVTCSFTCVECGEDAPELGDFGYIGYPSLDSGKGDRDIPNFGYIYAGLAAVGLVTDEVQAFQAFLVRHRGHQIDSSADGEPLFGDDDELEDDDLDEVEDEDDEGDDELDEGDEEDLGEDDEDPADDGEDATKRRGGPFLDARYVATCADCRTSFSTSQEYRFVPFDPRVLATTEIKRFLKQVVEAGPEAMYRAEPLYDGDLEGAGKFLRTHARHQVTAQLSPERKPTP